MESLQEMIADYWEQEAIKAGFKSSKERDIWFRNLLGKIKPVKFDNSDPDHYGA